jgi:hypothetical protein
MTLFCLLRGAEMLNIRINFAIDVKKVFRWAGAVLIVCSQLLTPAAQALPVNVSKEKAITVSLHYLTVSTTRLDAKRALSSPYVKYFDPETVAFLTEYSKGASIAEWRCLDAIWLHESHFNPKALNMGSQAFGIAQFLPSTWGNYKVKKTSSPTLQIKYGLHYIQIRYGDACNAWKFWKANGWY